MTPVSLGHPVQMVPPADAGPLPSVEEAAALLKNQAVYTSHMEAEARYIKVLFHYVML